MRDHNLKRQLARHNPDCNCHIPITQVCEDYGFAGQTAWTAINYFDRFLASATSTPKRKIELISLTCLLVASKFLECTSPSLEDLCTLAQNRLKKEDFTRCELALLTELDWQLAVPSPHLYLNHTMCLVCGDTSRTQHGPTLIKKHSEFFIDLSVFGESPRNPSFRVLALEPEYSVSPSLSSR